MDRPRSPLFPAACLAGALLTLSAGSVAAGSDTNSDPPRSRDQAVHVWDSEGFDRVAAKGLDLVYVRPDASLATYRKIQLLPVSVSFRRERGHVHSVGSRIRNRDLEGAEAIAELIRKSVAEELASGGYTLVDQAGSDVLSMELAVSDVFFVVPEEETAQRVDYYARSAGEMTLIASLRDSASGEMLVRVYDLGSAMESVYPRRMTRVDNVIETRRMATSWARGIRRQLDAGRVAQR